MYLQYVLAVCTKYLQYVLAVCTCSMYLQYVLAVCTKYLQYVLAVCTCSYRLLNLSHSLVAHSLRLNMSSIVQLFILSGHHKKLLMAKMESVRGNVYKVAVP